MPRNSKFRPYNLTSNNQRSFNVNQYKGVDYSTVKLNVDDEHAIDILNIIYKDNVNQKRNGWEQIAKATPVKYYVYEAGTFVEKTNTTSINAVWTFVGSDNKKYTVAHIGRLLFQVINFGLGKTFIGAKLVPIITETTVGDKTYNVALELNDSPSQAFYGANRLYILGGNKYYVLKDGAKGLEYAEVEDNEETYIPTTTVAITYKDSAVNLAAPLDDVNMLTQYRKNKLVSGTYVDDGVSLRTTRFWDYELDTTVHPKTKKDINNIKITINTLKEV